MLNITLSKTSWDYVGGRLLPFVLVVQELLVILLLLTDPSHPSDPKTTTEMSVLQMVLVGLKTEYQPAAVNLFSPGSFTALQIQTTSCLIILKGM